MRTKPSYEPVEVESGVHQKIRQLSFNKEVPQKIIATEICKLVVEDESLLNRVFERIKQGQQR